MKELTILLFCIIAMFVYMNYIRKSLHLSLIESSIDNQKYLVRNLKDNKDLIDQKIKKAKTDSAPIPYEAKELKNRHEATNLISVYSSLNNIEVI